MSKKENRRAARQAFPKAKPAAASRGRYAGGTRGRTSAASRSRVQGSKGRGQGGGQALRPPSIKRAAIIGAIMAFGFFVVVEWLWPSAGSTTQSNALISFIFFFVYSGVVYGSQRWKYQRMLRKLKGSSK
jgi:hypothetical protein